MVTLRNPNPDPPQQGNAFEITAGNGTAPYKFKWKVAEGDWEEVTQSDPKLEIDLPAGTRGQTLFVEVMDDTGEDDVYDNTISG